MDALDAKTVARFKARRAEDARYTDWLAEQRLAERDAASMEASRDATVWLPYILFVCLLSGAVTYLARGHPFSIYSGFVCVLAFIVFLAECGVALQLDCC